MNIDRLHTGMAQSVLREVAQALDTLAASGTRAAIDLRSLPMTAADRDDLDQALGRGDVAVSLEAAGRSEIWETGFAGIWWVRHFGGDGRVASEVIEITPVPDILAAHPDDIGAALQRLQADLARQGKETLDA
jgi:hydrogenase-1 operon protein HyaF